MLTHFIQENLTKKNPTKEFNWEHSMVVQAISSSTLEAKAGKSLCVLSQPSVHSEFQDSC